VIAYGEPVAIDVVVDGALTAGSTASDSASIESLSEGNDLPRATAEGITLSLTHEVEDFGSGPLPVVWVRGEHEEASTGVIVDPTTLFTADTIESKGWAGSGEVFVAMIATGNDVVAVRMTSAAGGQDIASTHGDGWAVLGVRASGVGEITVEALGARGDVLGVCRGEGPFLACSG